MKEKGKGIKKMMTIEELRKEKRYKQYEMAEIVGASKALYNAMEKFKVKGTMDCWLKIQEFYGLTDSEMWKLYLHHCKMVDKVRYKK